MGNPVSIGLKVAVMGAGMAYSASQKIEGPRLDNLDVSIAEFGTPLLDIYGSVKIDGVPYVHAEKLREKKVTTKTKGGKYANYKYYGTWLNAVCGHEIEAISRMWFDGKLVYDATKTGPISSILGLIVGLGSNAPVKLNRGRNFRVYLGTETQMPDPRYEEWCEDRYGPNSATAYRGTPILSFEELPLEKLGNRLPTVSAQAVRTKTDAMLYDVIVDPDIEGIGFSPDYDRFYTGAYGWDTATKEKIAGLSFTPAAAGSNGTLYNLGDFLGTGGGPFLTRYTADGALDSGTSVGTQPSSGVAVLRTSTGVDQVFLTSYFGVTNYVQQLSGTVLVPYDMGYVPEAMAIDEDDQIFVIGGGAALSFKLTAFPGPAYDTVTSPGTGAVMGAAFNVDNVLVVVQPDYIVHVDTVTGTVIDSAAIALGATTIQFAPDRATLWSISGVEAIEVDIVNLTVTRTLLLSDWLAVGEGAGAYDPINHAIVSMAPGGGQLTWRYLDRIADSGVLLSDLLENECSLAGVVGTSFTGTDVTIKGWSVAPGSVADRISPLLDLHDTDARAHDFNINFLVRGSAAALSIDSGDFVKDGDIRWQAPQVQDVDLPLRLSFTFADSDKDQQVNTATFQRPQSVTDSNRTQQLDMSTYVATPDEAQPLVDRYGRRRWFEREFIEFSLTLRECQLEPGDIRQIVLDGEPRTARLIELTRSGLKLGTKWVRDDPRVHDPNIAVGPTLDGRDDDELYISGPSKGWTLDIPLVQDSENSTNVAIQYGAGAYSLLHDWPGATIFQLDDVENEYGEWEGISATDKGTWGYTTNALNGASPAVWDQANSLNIRVKGALVSRSMADIDIDPTINLAYVGNEQGYGELLNFSTATLEADDTWTISNLKRGRRGTEWAIDAHAVSDLFVLASSMDVEYLGIDEIGSTITFKTQTDGRMLDGAPAIAVPIVARSLKPYAPAAFTAVRDTATDDWDFSWVRRTRVGGNWTGGAAIPLGETTEAYKLRIYDPADDSLVRTIDITSPTATYTSAQQTTDFGGPTTVFNATVVQVADAVEGFASAIERGAPFVRDAGAITHFGSPGSGIDPELPDYEVGDLLFLVCSVDGGATVTTPTGWEAITPQATSNSALYVFWKRAANSEATLNVVGTGTFIAAAMVSVGGVIPIGDPFDTSFGGTHSGSSTISVGGVTTTLDNTLIVDFASVGNDVNAGFSSATNASLIGFAEVVAGCSATSNGGGLWVGAGVKGSAGAVSASTTVFFESTDGGAIKLAIRPR